MKNLSTNELRKLWLDFFTKEKNHTLIAPASLIPVNDDTLLWINSGVAALKNYFDGSIKPPSPRLTNSQPSIRTNDIENVGVTARHHTLFEMLGNFSIGEYFKKEAISWAWEFLTNPKWLGLEKSKLYITVYEEDQETYDYWVNEVKIPLDHIIKGDKSTNFWEIGQGPCGPNTEIFYDRGLKFDPKNTGIKLLRDDIENDRYLEVWNIVFSQFNNNGDGTYSDLPQKNIDTGMGLERTASIIQEVPTNYDTDQFQIIIKEIAKYTSCEYKVDNIFNPVVKQSEINMAFKAIADHIKCNVFAIGDGAIPSNEKRGYVLRRLLRRSVNMARHLNIFEPFLYKLVDSICHYHQEFFPHLLVKSDHIKEIIKQEEEKFLQTIDKGYNKLESIITKNHAISGADAFLLFNSFGFPIELTSEISNKRNIPIDIDEFNKLFNNHKDLARQSFKSTTKMQIQSEALNKLDVTSTFLDEPTKWDTQVIAIIQNDKIVQKARGEMWLAFKESIFYVESGGQISDQGQVNDLEVIGLMKAPNQTRLHKVNSPSEIKVGDSVTLQIWDQRPQLRAHHSGSHLVHQVIKEMFGSDSNQAGKFVGNNRLRFDFTTTKKVSSSDMEQVEKLVNEKIKEKNIANIKEMPYQEAIDKGAIALFTEKYADMVRTVKIGDSFELCGGTHVANSDEVEQFVITSFESKGSGVYRIEGICTKKLCDQYNQDKNAELIAQYNTLKQKHQNYDYFEEFKNHYNEYLLNVKAFDKWKSKTAQGNKKVQKQKQKEIINQFKNLQDQVVKVGSYNVLALFGNAPGTIGRELATHYINLVKDLVFIWGSTYEDKSFVLVAISKSYQKEISAQKILNEINTKTNIKGGGNNSVAQGGGAKIDNLEEIIKSSKESINV